MDADGGTFYGFIHQGNHIVGLGFVAKLRINTVICGHLPIHIRPNYMQTHIRLSSALTNIYRIAIPFGWIFLFGIMNLMIWLDEIDGMELAGLQSKIPFLVLWIGGSASTIWGARKFRSVRLVEDQLMVSNFGRQEIVPLELIEEVRESLLSKPRCIQIKWRDDSGAAREFFFLAAFRFRLPFAAHPTVQLLRERIEENRIGSMPPYQRS